MERKSSLILAIGTAALLSALPVTAGFAQDSAAGRQMHESGAAMENAGSDTVGSARHAYHGSVDQLSDAALTTKVKSRLLKNSRTRKYSIHVESDQGTVTLGGGVDSPSTARYVQNVVAAVHGVRAVDNKLTWPISRE